MVWRKNMIVFLQWTLLFQAVCLCKSMPIGDKNLTMYTTGMCPRTELIWKQRSSDINCTETNSYMCLPNAQLSGLFEFCYTKPRIKVPKGVCLILNDESNIKEHACHSFQEGCPKSDYYSDSLYEYPTCFNVSNGCFLADWSCVNDTSTNLKFPDTPTTLLKELTILPEVATGIAVAVIVFLSIIGGICYSVCNRICFENCARRCLCCYKDSQNERRTNYEVHWTQHKREIYQLHRDAEYFFRNFWGKERQELIKELIEIRDSIQVLIKTHNCGKVVYSSYGLAGEILGGLGAVAAPFTGGASLALVTVGTALGVTSSVADLTHNAIKSSKISTQCENAQKKLSSHEQVCNNMNKMLKKFQVAIETSIENPLFNRTNGNTLEFISKLNELLREKRKKAMKGTPGADILTETMSLISSISNLNKNKLCEEANFLNDTIIQLNNEYNQLDDFFKQNHNTYSTRTVNPYTFNPYSGLTVY
uniref:Uncharacterized protein LOC111111574 n=1 Tax=Crassostrea virginica TaxID=6565 RepID=A0A8B8BNA7_CRAVI|nr:uncharacterized protein LOC111111574 [Crassostrea virginica]